MTEWRKDVVHSCYGCKMYYPIGHPERVGKPWSVKHCGGDHYKCDYFCNGGEPNVELHCDKWKDCKTKWCNCDVGFWCNEDCKPITPKKKKKKVEKVLSNVDLVYILYADGTWMKKEKK